MPKKKSSQLKQESVTSPEKIETSADTPVGDRDTKLRIRICLELRESTGKTNEKTLEVTIVGVKNLPKVSGKTFNPFVKLMLVPDRVIVTTELTINWRENSCENVEVFRFPIPDEEVHEQELHVDVCQGRLTRNSKIFGRAVAPIKDLKVGTPVIKWHELLSNVKEE